MPEQKLLRVDVQNSLQLHRDNAFTDQDLEDKIVQLVNDALAAEKATAAIQKARLEKLIFRATDVRDNQKKFWKGNKKLLPTCLKLELVLDEALAWFLANGYSIDRFTNKPQQKNLFHGTTTQTGD